MRQIGCRKQVLAKNQNPAATDTSIQTITGDV